MDTFPKRPMYRWLNVYHISKHAPVFISPSLYQFSSVYPVICSKSRKAPAALHANFQNLEVQHHIFVRVHVVSVDVHFAFLVSTFFRHLLWGKHCKLFPCIPLLKIIAPIIGIQWRHENSNQRVLRSNRKCRVS